MKYEGVYKIQYDPYQDWWDILDPDGVYICYVKNHIGAMVLLSHLNRDY